AEVVVRTCRRCAKNLPAFTILNPLSPDHSQLIYGCQTTSGSGPGATPPYSFVTDRRGLHYLHRLLEPPRPRRVAKALRLRVLLPRSLGSTPSGPHLTVPCRQGTVIFHAQTLRR